MVASLVTAVAFGPRVRLACHQCQHSQQWGPRTCHCFWTFVSGVERAVQNGVESGQGIEGGMESEVEGGTENDGECSEKWSVECRGRRVGEGRAESEG